MDDLLQHIRSIPSTRSTRRTPILLIVTATLVTTATYLVWKSIQTSHHLLDAENRHQALILVCDLAAEHVEQSPTHSWPRSWQDLEQLPPRDWSTFSWPRDSQQVQQLVEIDFTVTTAQVLSQRPDHFTAIRAAAGPAQFSVAGHVDVLRQRLSTATAK